MEECIHHSSKVKLLMELNIQKLHGHWAEGFALDQHTASSRPIKEMKIVKMIVDGKETEMKVPGEVIGWNTIRTEIAEHLYQLKYLQDKSYVDIISTEAANFLKTKPVWNLHKIIPVPPSETVRNFQPVYEMAKAIGNFCRLDVDFTTMKKVKATIQLKSIMDGDQRKEILKDAFDIVYGILAGKNVLLFDDLFRSGATLNAACDIIKNKGKAANVYVLTITKTRIKR